jgi:alkanesulfonate monooxygenase SsuD/methylene tetrahydromethanopterin reductase-like flavin-dependent oxidoreductase (luciferase family)
MKLGYFAMPVHPLHRDYTQVLREYREAVILRDELGFYGAFIGEHLTDKAERITNSMMFHATLIHSTKQIKLATGTTNLSHIHPVLLPPMLPCLITSPKVDSSWTSAPAPAV